MDLKCLLCILKNDSVAQLVEQLTLNQWVESSNLSGVTSFQLALAGVISSVGLEHYLDRVGVTGSNPVLPTNVSLITLSLHKNFNGAYPWGDDLGMT